MFLKYAYASLRLPDPLKEPPHPPIAKQHSHHSRGGQRETAAHPTHHPLHNHQPRSEGGRAAALEGAFEGVRADSVSAAAWRVIAAFEMLV